MPPAVQPSPLPVVVVGGFLGAGKTTLLNRWLRDPAGQRLAVLVNDFGALNIDAALLAGAASGAGAGLAGAPVALSNGCVCCTLGDDLGAALAQVQTLVPPPDAIVVESSGVADPWRVAQYAVADPGLALQAVVVVVDAAAIEAQAADPLLADTLARPLAHADLVLLNKADLAGAAGLAAARQWLAAQDEAAHAPPVLDATEADLPWAALADAPRHVARGGWPPPVVCGGWPPHQGRGWPAGPGAHDARFEAWSVAPAGRFDAARLRAWIDRVPAAVLRLKALLPLADGGWALLQWAGRRGRLRRLPGDAAPPGGAAVVAIGLRGALPADALAAGLRRCTAPSGHNAASSDPNTQDPA